LLHKHLGTMAWFAGHPPYSVLPYSTDRPGRECPGSVLATLYDAALRTGESEILATVDGVRAAWQDLRDQLVDGLELAGHVSSERVAAALRAVPRHVFVPGIEPEQVYEDKAFPIKYDESGRPISSSSQPAIVARMLGQLELQAGHRVLEIGTGSGYNAALLGHLVGETGAVVSVDIDADLVTDARERLAACGVSQITVVCGDGGLGWSEHAPYDRIIATVGAWDIPPAWVAQLAPHGRLVVPLDLRGPQRSIAFQPIDSHLESVSVLFCGFIRMRGAFAGPESIHHLGPERGVILGLAEQRPIDADGLYAALTQPGVDVPSGVRVTLNDAQHGLGLWLALHEPAIAGLSAIGAAANHGLVPALLEYPGRGTATVALVGTGALAALVRLDQEQSFELGARPLGPEGHRLAQRLVGHIHDWNTRGRPGTAGLQVSAYPRDSDHAPTADADSIIEKRYTRLALYWAA
jgi:protein-L-isoaspartate(D-aspartate) O-methyltransferase